LLLRKGLNARTLRHPLPPSIGDAGWKTKELFMGTIRFAKIENSERLQRAHKLLSDGQWHGTREIIRAADVCAVNSIITELRCNGFDVLTRCVGQGRYEYMLLTDGQLGLL